MRFRLFAPLRAKVTSSTRSLALLSQGSRLLILAEPHDELRGASFDHLVSAGEQRGRDFEAEYLGGSEVDNEIELGRLLHRQVVRLRPAQNFIDILGSAAKKAWQVCSIRHQSPPQCVPEFRAWLAVAHPTLGY